MISLEDPQAPNRIIWRCPLFLTVFGSAQCLQPVKNSRFGFVQFREEFGVVGFHHRRQIKCLPYMKVHNLATAADRGWEPSAGSNLYPADHPRPKIPPFIAQSVIGHAGETLRNQRGFTPVAANRFGGAGRCSGGRSASRTRTSLSLEKTG